MAQEIDLVTPEEFEAMEKEERFNYELINGIVMMSPSPSREHQGIGFKVNGFLFRQIDSHKCTGYYETDIKINDNIYKPDISIFCNDGLHLCVMFK